MGKRFVRKNVNTNEKTAISSGKRRGGPCAPDAEVVTEVVTRVADARGVDPFEMPPLIEAINPDALNKIFKSSGDENRRYDGHLAFTYCDREVVVYPDGVVEVLPARDAPDPTVQ